MNYTIHLTPTRACAWPNRLGTPTDRLLHQWIVEYCRSLQHGGTRYNESVARGYMLYPASAEVVDETGGIVASWKAPPTPRIYAGACECPTH